MYIAAQAQTKIIIKNVHLIKCREICKLPNMPVVCLASKQTKACETKALILTV